MKTYDEQQQQKQQHSENNNYNQFAKAHKHIKQQIKMNSNEYKEEWTHLKTNNNTTKNNK